MHLFNDDKSKRLYWVDEKGNWCVENIRPGSRKLESLPKRHHQYIDLQDFDLQTQERVKTINRQSLKMNKDLSH